MIDFIKRLYVFSRDGFECGYYVITDEHIRFYILHKKEKLKIVITICFHFEKQTKYNFCLFIKDEAVYKKNADTEKDIILISNDIECRVSEYLTQRKINGN